MQRKQLLKGQVYRAGSNLVRVLDTSESPVDAERYDFIQQEWIAAKVHPRDIDMVYAPQSLSELSQASETLNAAAKRRLILEVIAAINEQYSTSVEVALHRRDFSISLHVSSQESAIVGINKADATILFSPITPLPEGAEVRVPAQSFVTWAVSVKGGNVDLPKAADIHPTPGAKPELLNAQTLREAQKVADLLKQRIGEASRLEHAVIEREIQVVEARGDDAMVKEFGRTWVHWYSLRDLPEYATKVDAALAAEGLSRDYLNGGKFSAPHSKTPAELLEYAATL